MIFLLQGNLLIKVNIDCVSVLSLQQYQLKKPSDQKCSLCLAKAANVDYKK